MKFFKLKRFLSIVLVIIAGSVIVFLLTITRTNHPSITENEVRSQLEQTYDAEVAIVKKNEAVYDALITKNGIVYSVEMDALTGEVNSLKQSDEYIVQTEREVAAGPIELIPEQPSPQIVGQPDVEKAPEDEKETGTVTGPTNAPTKIIISEKKTATNKEVDASEKPKTNENTVTKYIISATSKIEEKVEDNKPEKEISKDSLKVETSKQEETKVETPKEDTVKAEEKVEPMKLVNAKPSESAKAEEQKSEETQVQVQTSQTNTVQSETKKSETETKSETKTDTTATVLISEEQAIKKAQQQQKGTVESSSFVKTNEGGYYLIVMKATVTEGDSKENAKEKKTKATIQVHAISGKILSVTWE
ncbi:PepSY domain-containing protein [Psychrobacillus sp. NPDC096389]|uniref:PepSY domain-containing protein n=1 Tax=Psychrobacillus sp. NPDC096389 TaxID=3364490 RepID=UPI0038152198